MNKLLTLLTTCVLVLSATVANAQLNIQVRQMKAITGLGEVTMVDDAIFVGGDPKIEIKDVTALMVNPEADIEVETEDRRLVIVDESESTPGLYLFDKAGSYYVRVELLDWEAHKRYKKIIKVIVKSGVKPVPADAKYPNTLKNIGKLVGSMSKGDRTLSAQVLRAAARKLSSSEFLQQAQVSTFIKSNRPNNAATNALFAQLSKESRKEGSMGLATVAEYYSEIADYIDVAPRTTSSYSILKKADKPVSFLPSYVTPHATQPTPLPPALR